MAGSGVSALLANARAFQSDAARVQSVEVADAAGTHPEPLSDRGQRLMGELLKAGPELLTEVEALLATKRAVRETFVSPNQAAVLLGVSRPTVVAWAAQGMLVDVQVGAHHRFRRSEVVALRDRRLEEAAANRERARAVRAELTQEELAAAPSPQELAAAGAALRRGEDDVARKVLARARSAAARDAAARASTPA